jgi:hypothetical protein
MRIQTIATCLALCLVAGAAHAKPGYPDEYALRPLQLPESMVQLKVPLIVDLSRGQAGKTIWVPFDLRFGVTNELELRIFHPVHGLCLRGCDKAYDDLGFGLLYAVFDEDHMQVSLLGAFEVRRFTRPVRTALDAGLAFAYIRAPFSIHASPYLGIPITDRAGQDAWVNVPIELAYQLSPPTALFLETGLYGSARDPNAWSGPIGVGINQLLQHSVDVGAEFKLNSVIGNTDTGNRLVLVYLMVRN